MSSSTGARMPIRTRPIPPTTIAASAILKIGHHCRSMKSTTAPDINPVPKFGASPTRLIRSITLPTAPPTTMPMNTSCRIDVDFLAMKIRTPATTSATRPMSGPLPAPFENAIPVLNARLNRSENSTSTISPELKRRNAQTLESWSSNTTDMVARPTAPQR